MPGLTTGARGEVGPALERDQPAHREIRHHGHLGAALGREEHAHVRLPAARPDDDARADPLSAGQVHRAGAELTLDGAVEVDRDLVGAGVARVRIDIEADPEGAGRVRLLRGEADAAADVVARRVEQHEAEPVGLVGRRRRDDPEVELSGDGREAPAIARCERDAVETGRVAHPDQAQKLATRSTLQDDRRRHRRAPRRDVGRARKVEVLDRRRLNCARSTRGGDCQHTHNRSRHDEHGSTHELLPSPRLGRASERVPARAPPSWAAVSSRTSTAPPRDSLARRALAPSQQKSNARSNRATPAREPRRVSTRRARTRATCHQLAVTLSVRSLHGCGWDTIRGRVPGCGAMRAP